MKMLGVLLFASPHVDLQIDMKSIAPNYAVATSKEQVINAIEGTNEYAVRDHKHLHYLGMASCSGYHQLRFVIRAFSYEHAYAIIKNYIGRINSSMQMQGKFQQSSTLFSGGLVSDEEANKSELRKFIEFASSSMDPLLVLARRGF